MKQKFIGGVLLAILFLAVLMLLIPSGEPMYQGKPLSKWLPEVLTILNRKAGKRSC